MNYEYLHEVEHVELPTPIKRPVAELLSVFKSLGFAIHDDVASLDRNEKIPPWQHSSIVEVKVQRDGEEVFGFEEGEWDELRCEYLFAYLPYELTERFVEVVFALSRLLSTPVKYRGACVDEHELKDRFTQIRADLLSETGVDAGSEWLAILIHGTYPRRSADSLPG